MKTLLLAMLTGESLPDRRWCGNEEAGRGTHHGSIPDEPDPVVIQLSWKAKDGAPDKYIGTFELHLNALLAGDYIKAEANDHVRVKFIHDCGKIKLAQGKDRPGLVVGEWKS